MAEFHTHNFKAKKYCLMHIPFSRSLPPDMGLTSNFRASAGESGLRSKLILGVRRKVSPR